MCCKIYFISKSFLVIKLFSLSLLYGSSSNIQVFQVILSDRHHGVDACLMLLYNIIQLWWVVGLTCRCNLSNIMPDSISYDSMGWGITCFVLFCFKGDNHCVPQHTKDGFCCLIILTTMGLGKL